MTAFHIIPSSATSQAAHHFNSYQGHGAGGHEQPNPNDQPAPPSLIASMRWMVTSASALDMSDARRVQQVLKTPLTLGEALQLQQQLLSRIHDCELEQMGRRRQQIAATIHHCPEFWNNTWFGRDRAQSYISTITDEETELAQLNTALFRVEAENDLWYHIRHLVEEALVNGAQMEAAMRKAVRNPKSTEADDAATMRKLAAKLLANQGPKADKWALQQTSQRVHEMLVDAENPQHLVQVLVQTLKEVEAVATTGK